MQRILAVLALVLCSTLAVGGDWPAWRGPTGQGFTDDSAVPLSWGPTENVKWKVPLEHPGNSTPIVWKDRIFLTQANKGGSVRSLLCFARAGGKLLWQKDVSYPHPERNWGGITYTNASAVTDGERVVVSFASAGMYCYDLDGKELWRRTDLGHWEHGFGSGSSPVLYGRLAYLWCGPNVLPPRDGNAEVDAGPKAKGKKGGTGKNVLIAVDKTTGKTVWEHEEKAGSWGTPLVTAVNGQDQLLLATVPHLLGLGPASGKKLWWCNGLRKYVYPSPLYGNGIAVAMSGFHGDAFAVRLGGAGDITQDRLWQQLEKRDKIPQRVGSGMIVGDHVYIVEENGLPRCFEVTTGEEVWKVDSRPGSSITWGAMVHVRGRLYVLMRNGDTLVFAASPRYEHLATNSLGRGEQTNSSLAVSDGELFIRTFRNLWCIAEKK